jgi:hypothetical protein
MMAISFTRAFQHEDWVDNVDRVQAAGDNGFNERFHGIEADFDSLGRVVEAISRALDALSAAPPALELRESVTPAFVATSGTGWSHRNGFAEKAAGQTTAAGMTSVSLPHGARVLRLRAVGRNSGGGNLRIALMRQLVADPGATSEQLARVEGTTDPFDQSIAADPAFQRVDDERFKYFITAQLNNALAADVVAVTAMQVVYATS